MNKLVKWIFQPGTYHWILIHKPGCWAAGCYLLVETVKELKQLEALKKAKND